MNYDFNILERRAKELVVAGRIQDALTIYFFMADGDPSLDGGYLGQRIGHCYELLGQYPAAKFWYGRAIEENPEVRWGGDEAIERLKPLVAIDALLKE
ncbi:MAG TPA: tetratricopeptide repeat protein [Stellaceae bacterium]|jgi:tetratricopeptide (TPR) repeat protein|nr:tetratricopeptide repeat protein [Stellaceae bacterium]